MDFKSLLPFGRGTAPAAGEPDVFGNLQREINRMFDDVWRGHRLPGMFSGDQPVPRIDIKETETGLEVSAELPGVAEKDLSVELSDDALVIKGEKKLEKDEKKDNYHVMERSYGMFQRVIPLPYAPVPDSVKAAFANGVLKITMARPPSAESKTRKIAVEAS